MKNTLQYFLSVITLISGISFSATAIRHVGGGGGISEQNLVFSFENMKDLLQICFLECELQENQEEVLRSFVRAVAKTEATLRFDSRSCSGSHIEGTIWSICLPQIHGFDLDGDGFLDLKESVLMLFQIHAINARNESPEVEALSEKLIQVLERRSFNYLFVQSDGPQFQIFGYHQDPQNLPVLYIQSENTEALELRGHLTALSTCANVQLMRPYVVLQSRQGDVRKFVLVFPTVEFCGADSSVGKAQKRILEFQISKDSIQLRQ